MPKVLKFWHSWSWLYHILFGSIAFTIYFCDYKNAIGNNTADIKAMQAQHDKENPDHRITVLEQIAQDNKENFQDIKDTEKAIFQRINQIADNQR